MSLSAADIRRCSSPLVEKPAKEGTGTSATLWLVGRVKGGFMITRSAEPCSITKRRPSSSTSTAPLPDAAVLPVPKSDMTPSSAIRSREPIAAGRPAP